MADARKIPAPIVTVETQAFWNAARERRFVVPDLRRLRQGALVSARDLPVLRQRQDRNGARPPASGTIYTFSVMRRAKEPYAIAYVTLAEGPTMLTNIVDCDFDALAIGQPVSVVFQDTENGPPVPMFRPA